MAEELHKVFGAHPCWIRDFTPASMMHYGREGNSLDRERLLMIWDGFEK
jgi:hypothetical protein